VAAAGSGRRDVIETLLDLSASCRANYATSSKPTRPILQFHPPLEALDADYNATPLGRPAQNGQKTSKAAEQSRPPSAHRFPIVFVGRTPGPRRTPSSGLF